MYEAPPINLVWGTQVLDNTRGRLQTDTSVELLIKVQLLESLFFFFLDFGKVMLLVMPLFIVL